MAASRRAPTCGLSFSDNDPGHSKTSAVEQKLDGGKAKDKRPAAGDRQQAVASGEPESSGVGGGDARHDHELNLLMV